MMGHTQGKVVEVREQFLPDAAPFLLQNPQWSYFVEIRSRDPESHLSAFTGTRTRTNNVPRAVPIAIKNLEIFHSNCNYDETIRLSMLHWKICNSMKKRKKKKKKLKKKNVD